MAGARVRFLAALVVGAAVISGSQPAAGAPSADAPPDLCATTGPIPAARLASGVRSADCSLVGRVVVSGAAAVVVPPDGIGVGADGLAAGTGSDGPSLQVQNVGGVVRAVEGAPDSGAGQPASPRLAAREAGPCAAKGYALESGGHPWGGPLKWRYQRGSTPKRLGKYTSFVQIRAGITNMATGRDSCGLKGHPKASASYLGRTSTRPHIRAGKQRVTCGAFDRTNVVGWGTLPSGLIGWTCYWWGAGGAMIGADMRISPAPRVVLAFPQRCSAKYDLQSIATHEWGHAFGLGHVANSSLTMHHFLPPCSTAFRTLGLGDFKGMKRLYGVH